MVKMPNWRYREIKVFQRDEFFSGISKRYSYLTLPGGECEDINRAVELSIINKKQTHLTVTEQSCEYFGKMCDWLAMNWESDNLHRPSVPTHLNEIGKLRPLDLVFLDYNGNATQADSVWIKNVLVPSLLPQAHLGMTVSKATRNNQFIPDLRQVIETEHYELFIAMCKVFRDGNRFPSDLFGHLAVYAILFKHYFLRHHAFRFTPFFYGEADSPHVMLLLKVENITPSVNKFSPEEIALQEEIERFVESKMRINRSGIRFKSFTVPTLLSSINRRLALSARAHKAVATRRANKAKELSHA